MDTLPNPLQRLKSNGECRLNQLGYGVMVNTQHFDCCIPGSSPGSPTTNILNYEEILTYYHTPIRRMCWGQ